MGLLKKIVGLTAKDQAPDGDAKCRSCPPGLPGQDAEFSAAVTALGAKLASADGRPDHGEYEAFAEVFQPDARSERDVRRLYQLARQTTHGYESYAKRLGKRYRHCPGLLEDVLDGLFHVAVADGYVTQEELAYLERVCGLLGLSPLTFRRVRATHLGAAEDDPYTVLGVEPDAPEEVIRQARRRLLADSHPDRVRARGLPAEFIEVFNAKAAAVNAAFDAIMRERRELAGALA